MTGEEMHGLAVTYRAFVRGQSTSVSTFFASSSACSAIRNQIQNVRFGGNFCARSLFTVKSVASFGGSGKQRVWTSLREGSPVLCSHFSTSSYCKDSEVDRVSQAYLGNQVKRSVQKHDGNRLVYEVRGQTMLRFVTLTFYATAAVGLYLAPDFISSALENEALNQETITNLMAVAFAVIGLPASLRMLSKRLVLKLYHNEARETYHAITQSLFLTNKATKFSLYDVVVKEKKSMLSQMFNLTTLKANRQPLHVNPQNFKLPSDYNHLLGYDKFGA